MIKEETLSFLKNKNPKLCVIATATTEGKPEAAVMGYAIKDDLTVFLSTHTETRKYQNLAHNSKVSLVIGWDFTEDNVQIDGSARVIEKGDEHSQIEQFFFNQNPGAKAFKSENTVFIEIKPSWIRFMNRKVEPTQISEETIN